MAYFHTTVLDNQIKALPTVDTASGSIATFDTDMTENLIEVVCDIQYTQASGTPTPVNPLPITTYTSLNLSHSGADTSNPTVYNIPFGQTVAKGTLNVTTGVLEITHGAVDMGVLTYNTTGGGVLYVSKNTIQSVTGLNPKRTVTAECVCSVDVLTQSENQIRFPNISEVPSDVPTVYNGQMIVFELDTPTTIQLSATQITALLNENNIWCDTNGDTSVKYILSVGKAIS